MSETKTMPDAGMPAGGNVEEPSREELKALLAETTAALVSCLRLQDNAAIEQTPNVRAEAVQLLAYWQHSGNSFGCKLFKLIQCADPKNKRLLRLAYPAYVQVFDEWMAEPDGDAYIKRALVESGRARPGAGSSDHAS